MKFLLNAWQKKSTGQKSQSELATPPNGKPSGIYLEMSELIKWIHSCPKFKINPNAKTLASMTGQYISKMRGRGVDFSEVRLYQPGDDVRSMDWRVTARTSKPHIKMYEEERERPVFILVDQGPSLFFGSRYVFKSYYAARLAALIGWHAVRQGDRLGGLIFNQDEIKDLPIRRGNSGWQIFCRHLIEFNQALKPELMGQPSLSWKKVLSHLNYIIRPGSLIIIISDFFPKFDTNMGLLTGLSRHNDMLAIQITDPMEITLPNRLATYSNGEEKFSIDGGHESMQLAYQQRQQNNQNSLEQQCKQAAIPLLKLSTGDHMQTLARFLDGKPR